MKTSMSMSVSGQSMATETTMKMQVSSVVKK
jgi:hypothetical protein